MTCLSDPRGVRPPVNIPSDGAMRWGALTFAGRPIKSDGVARHIAPNLSDIDMAVLCPFHVMSLGIVAPQFISTATPRATEEVVSGHEVDQHSRLQSPARRSYPGSGFASWLPLHHSGGPRPGGWHASSSPGAPGGPAGHHASGRIDCLPSFMKKECDESSCNVHDDEEHVVGCKRSGSRGEA